MNPPPPDVVNDIMTYDFHATEEYERFRKALSLRRFKTGFIFLQHNFTAQSSIK